MINKFKKGGSNNSILAKIQQLPKELQLQVLKAFSQWALLKGIDIQLLLKDPNALEEALGQFMQELQQQQTKAARHGAKLNYLKSLKNQCAEDEELVYYKKGGSIGCGCKKIGKKEIGGEVKKKSAVSKFKEDLATRDSIEVNKYGNEDIPNNRPGSVKPNKDGIPQWTPDRTKSPYNKKPNKVSIVSKFKAKCGSKLKKHQLGGSLNEIPFMQTGGSFKQAWNEARKNKVRYFNYNGKMYNSKAAGIDNEYNTFRDNMNEMSALLPTDNSPKHLGWERNNPISNELRGGDRQIKMQGTESTLPEITVIGNKRAPKSSTKTSVKSEVYYNVPLGRIEYIGRDGQKYWMSRADSDGHWYYDKIENSANYGPRYHKAVPEGYIIPGTNTPITKNSENVKKMILGLKKKYLKQGGSLNEIPFYREGKQLPTAPKAEDRYRNGRKTWNTPNYKEVSSAGNIFMDPFASKIAMEVSNNGNDTTFYETSGRWLPVKFKTRTAKSINKIYKPIQVSNDGFKSYRVIGRDPEYEILKRRFNTAWNVAK